MTEPWVTVIIPCFDGEEFISEAIESVLGQTYQNWDLIVVDDGSTDSSLGLLKKFAADYPRQIRVLSGPNRGACHARNWAIAEAEGGLVALLDADDVWHPQKLETQVHYLVTHPDVLGVTTGYSLWGQESHPPANERYFDWSRTELIDWAMLGRSAPALCSTLLVSRAAVIESGGFDVDLVSFAEDLDLAWRLSAVGRMASINALLVRVRLSDSQIHRNSEAMLRGIALFYRKLSASHPRLSQRGLARIEVYRLLIEAKNSAPNKRPKLIFGLLFKYPADLVRFGARRHRWLVL